MGPRNSFPECLGEWGPSAWPGISPQQNGLGTKTHQGAEQLIYTAPLETKQNLKKELLLYVPLELGFLIHMGHLIWATLNPHFVPNFYCFDECCQTAIFFFQISLILQVVE